MDDKAHRTLRVGLLFLYEVCKDPSQHICWGIRSSFQNYFYAVENTNYKLIAVGSPDYEEMVALRMKVLLEPIGIPRSYVDPQKEARDLLIGAYQNDELIGCCILTKVDEQTVQLRQMAVDRSCQGKGVGASILAIAEKVAEENGYRVLMMHARDSVLSFYQKCGYEIYDQPFSEVGIGHHKMRKRLTGVKA